MLAQLVAALRIIEVVQVTVNAAVFDSFTRKQDNRILSAARMLVLGFVNFVELCVCFGIVYAANFKHLVGAGQPVTAFYFSIVTQLTIGYGDVFPTGGLRICAAVQGLISLIFVVLVFARFVTTLPRIDATLEPECAEWSTGDVRPDEPTNRGPSSAEKTHQP